MIKGKRTMNSGELVVRSDTGAEVIGHGPQFSGHNSPHNIMRFLLKVNIKLTIVSGRKLNQRLISAAQKYIVG